MKTNRILALLLAVVMLLSIFAGCNTTKPDGTDPSGSDETETTNGDTDTTTGTEDPTGTTGSDPAGNETVSGTETTEPKKPIESETTPTQPNGCTHNWSSWTTKKASSCTADGSEERTCSNCGKKEQRTATATGHNWDAGKETGSNIAYTCTVCGSTKTEQIKGNHTYGEWKWEEYTFKHSSGGTYTSHRKYRTCTKCGFKETSGSDHICQKGSDNHTVTTVKAGTCTTKATMRSTCKVCGWYLEYDGKKGQCNWVDKKVHLSDYGQYTNELDATVSECTGCGDKSIVYHKGEGWSDYNRYRFNLTVNQGNATNGQAPVTDNFSYYNNPQQQMVKRDFVYDSDGYVKQFTVYWWYNGSRYSQVIKCGAGELEAWFAEYGLTGGAGYNHSLKVSGTKIVPYKVSWTG